MPVRIGERLWARLRGGERGAVTAEIVVVFPLLLTLVLLLAQVTLWGHAAHIAQATAAEALSATRVDGGSAQDGRTSAKAILRQLAGDGPHVTRVHVRRDADRAEVRITGSATRVVPLPLLRLPVTGRAAGPVEHFRTAAGES